MPGTPSEVRGERRREEERERERAAGAGEEEEEEEEGGQEAAVACVPPFVRQSVPEGEPRCEAPQTHNTHTHTHGPAGQEAAAALPGMCVWDAAEGERWRSGRLLPPRRGGPMAGGTCGGWLGDGEKEGRQEGRGAGGRRGARRRCPASQPLPGPAAWAFPVLFPARAGGEGKAQGNGARRYVTGARGPGLPAREGGGDTGTEPVRAREAPRGRARCARVRVTAPPRTCASVCLSVLSVRLCLSHGACAADTTRVPQAEAGRARLCHGVVPARRGHCREMGCRGRRGEARALARPCPLERSPRCSRACLVCGFL